MPYGRHPLLQVWDERRGEYRYPRRPVCFAICGREEPDHPEGTICGDPAHNSAANVPLCDHHYERLRQWGEALPCRTTEQAIADIRAVHEEQVELDELRAQKLAEREMAHICKRNLAIATAGVVYYVRRDADGLIKIGTTTKLGNRMSNLRGVHGPLRLMAVRAGGRPQEIALHQKFAELRETGEWFRPELSLLDHIARLRRPSASSNFGTTITIPGQLIHAEEVFAMVRSVDPGWVPGHLKPPKSA